MQELDKLKINELWTIEALDSECLPVLMNSLYVSMVGKQSDQKMDFSYLIKIFPHFQTAYCNRQGTHSYDGNVIALGVNLNKGIV